jgi:hypothetical protein
MADERIHEDVLANVVAQEFPTRPFESEIQSSLPSGKPLQTPK